MLWKEINCEGATRSPVIALAIFGILLTASFLPAALIIWSYCENFYQEVTSWRNLGQEMNIWVRTCNVIVGYLALLAVGIRASTSVTTEREKQTFDTLLTTPLDSTPILSAKWAGSVLGARFGILWLVLIWSVGIVTGGLSIVGMILVIVAWLAYASFAAALGLWFSVTSRSSLRATVWTILTLIIASVGHWLIWMCCAPIMMFGGRSGGSERAGEYLLKLQAGILTPGFVMAWVPFSNQDLSRGGDEWNKTAMELTGFALMGIVAWSIAAGALFGMTCGRFRQLTRRESEMYPDRGNISYSRDRVQRSSG